MKVTSFHFMPYRDLPDDVDSRYRSVWVDAPWWELGDAEKVGDYYNQSLDELLLAAELGFDGLGTNEHHQNPYGFMCNPNLFGAILARLTRDRGFDDVALVQLGATLAATSPPIRIAEEYAVLDCLSGGRLIAGVPLGVGADANISYGITPIEQRERWREAIELMLKAWTAEEFFAWNGKHYQLPKVNLWPRPVQKPHPPLLVPGAASSSTWDFCHERDLPYAFLSYFGGASAEYVMDRFWERAAANGKDDNPYRASFLQLVGVAETDERAEAEYSRHIETFYHKLLHFLPVYFAPPGYSDYKSLVNVFRTSSQFEYADPANLKPLTARDMIAKEFVVVGSPATVRERLEAMARRLNVGHLMTILQFGSMPHELAMRNIELFGREVLPHLQGVWQDHGVGEQLVAGEASQYPGAPVARRGPGRGVSVPTVETISIRHCGFEAKVKVAGSGSPLVYLHAAGGPRWDSFLDLLAARHTVYAPDHPGTGDTARESIYAVESLWDLVLIYDEILDALGLASVALVGSSFGGMVACELAAHRPDRIRRLVLLDPIGLWRDDAPVTPYMLLTPEEVPATLFHNLEAEPVQDALRLPSDPDELALALADSVWALGATGKFVWPIPDKGLKKRIHRISAPTLILWGREDRLISPVYAQEFAGRIAEARVEIIENAGHVPQLEQLETVAPLVLDFLD